MAQHARQDATRTMAPPRGRLYDVNGRRLALHRSGDGGPAVVFLPGASTFGLYYLNLHDRLSAFTTSVLYDRAGTGWSDRVDLPRTAAEVADELHELLRVASVPAPYVLVAHSLGGVYARRFAQRFPDEVAGMVALDAFHEEWDDYMPEQFQLGQFRAYDESMPEIGEELIAFARDLFTRMLAEWPDDVREPVIARHLDAEAFSTGMQERSNFAEIADELRHGGKVPDVPMLSFTAMGSDPGQQLMMSEQLLREQNEAKLAMYTALANAVPDGENRVLEGASHSWLHIERADAVVQGIRDVLDKARRHGGG